ncbi:MAG: NTP-transf-3 domain-containing protein [Succiniclasticum sp.]|jgi:hypothetical protein
MKQIQYDLVILAGGTGCISLPGRQPEPRALAPLKGRRLLYYMARAAAASRRIRRVIVVTHPDKVAAFRAAFPTIRYYRRDTAADGTPQAIASATQTETAGREFTPEPAGTGPVPPLPVCLTECAGTMGEVGWAGLRLARILRQEEDGTPLTEPIQVAVTMEDVPFLTGEAIADFVGRAEALGADGVYPLVTKESCRREFPTMRRTYFHLAEGDFTGGNLVFVRDSVFPSCLVRIAEVYKLRKNVPKLAGWLGFSMIVKFLLRRLSAADVEQKVSRTFGLKGRCIQTDYACIGTDLDRAEDWPAAEAYIKDFAEKNCPDGESVL